MTHLALSQALQRLGYQLETLVDLRFQVMELEAEQRAASLLGLLERFRGREVRLDDPLLLETLSGLSPLERQAFWLEAQVEPRGRKKYYFPEK